VLVDPRDADAWTQRAEAHLGRHDWDSAISDCTVALDLHPKKIAALNHRGSAWLAKQDLQKALADFDSALTIDPHNAVALTYRAQIRRLRGELFRALEDVDLAIRYDPNSAPSFNERASIRAALGDVSAAISDCTTALLVGGQNAPTLLLRGMLAMQRAEYARAREDFDAVLTTGGELATPARIHLAWLLATCPDDEIRDGARASRLAHEAGARAAQEDPAVFDALAAAQAELGEFSAALAAGHKAIAVTAENRIKERNARRARIDLYLSGKPCRLPTAPSVSP
jgi:tetratricopeptide (TPR) repeat protein